MQGSSSVPDRPPSPIFSHDPSTDEEEEHTLCAFGEISLSNIYFIPSLPSDVSPRRDDPWIKNEKKTPPPSVRKTTHHALPSVIRRILPPTPSTAELSPGSDFKRLVSKLKERQIPASSPGLTLPLSSKSIHRPQAREAIGINDLQAKASAEYLPARDRVPVQTSARLKAARPKPKEKPFRGGRLPVRPPLPRWDLHNTVASTANSPTHGRLA